MLNASEIYSGLSPDLATLDVERARLYKKTHPINIGFFTLLLGGGALLYWLLNNALDATLNWYVPVYCGTTFICFILWAFGRDYYKQKFKKLFISEIVPKIVTNLGADFTYDHEQQVSPTEVRDSLLFPDFNKFDSEDLVRGTIDGVTLKFAEIKLVKSKAKSSGSGSTHTTIFKGVYFNASLHVTFPTSIWLVTSEFDDKLKDSKLAKVVLEDNPMRKYKYFAQDPEVAKSVLKPFILEKIDALNQRLKSEGIAKKPLIYRFSKNRVQLAIWTKHGLFEPRLSQTINSREFIEKQTAPLNAIAGLLGELTLN